MSQTSEGHPQRGSVPGPRSAALWREAVQYEPKGVQGEGKYYPPYPFFVRDARGAHIVDADGRSLLDYWAAAGPAVLGHSDPEVLEAAVQTMKSAGVLYTAPHSREMDLARELADLVPSAEVSGFVCGGSDAIAYGVRVARSATGRKKILKFEGGYHGWYDAVLFSVRPDLDLAGPDESPVPFAESSGLPESAREDIVVLPYNEPELLENYLSEHGHKVAVLIVEPILHSCGAIFPKDGYLERIRELCTQYGIVLLFDEIITGFRHDLGGAQRMFGVTPDLTALGKAMSNGFPISALVGRRDLMEELAPSGEVFFSGTFNGNVLCVSAALATIEKLRSGEIHAHTSRLGEHIRKEINDSARRWRVTVRCVGHGSVWTLIFSDREPQNYRELVRLGDKQWNAQEAYRLALLERDIFMFPRWINRNYISAAHSEEDIERTIRATDEFFSTKSGEL